VTEASYPRDPMAMGPQSAGSALAGECAGRRAVRGDFEEGGENNILHGDRASEAFLSDVLGAQPWPGQRHANIESMFGIWLARRLLAAMAIFNARKLPVTVFGVATALKRNPRIVAAMKEAGWDVASHSLKWVEHKDMSEAEERGRDRRRYRIHTEVVGQRPLGWYTGAHLH